MIMVRFADDLVVGFQHENDARRFRDAMRDRLREFSLSLHPDKTRLIEFGAMRRRTAGSAGSPSRRPSRSWALCSLAANLDGAISKSEGSLAETACVRSSGRSRKRCDNEGTGRSLKLGNGLRKSSPGISPTTPCRPIALPFTTSSSSSGTVNCVGAAREQGWYGSG